MYIHTHRGFPGEAPSCLYRRYKRCRLSPWVEKILWRRAGNSLPPAFLPGESHGQRSRAGYSPQGHKRVRHD